MDMVFNLLGSTGSPKINQTRPASFMMSNLYCAINMLMASQINNVKNYLYLGILFLLNKISFC